MVLSQKTNDGDSPWVKKFSRQLYEDGKAERTIASYTSDVKRFVQFHCETNRRSVETTDRQDVVDFLEPTRLLGVKPATFNKLVNSLSCICAYLADQGVVSPDRALVVHKRDRVKVAVGSEKEVSVLTDSEVDHLMVFLSRTDKVSQRDRLLVLFLLYIGCRVSETVGVKMRDLDLLSGVVTVHGKGRKLREVPLRPDLAEEIHKYLRGERRESRFHESEHLFVSQRSAMLNRDTINIRRSDHRGAMHQLNIGVALMSKGVSRWAYKCGTGHLLPLFSYLLCTTKTPLAGQDSRDNDCGRHDRSDVDV